MLSIYDLTYLKEQYNGHKIIYALFDNKEFVFKSLTRKEYKDILNITASDDEFEDAICQIALIYPEEYDFSQAPLAGISHNISPIILEQSNFTSLNDVLDIYEESKKQILTLDQNCMTVVKAAMPEYTFEEMEDWTWDKLMLMLARAEKILELTGNKIELINNQEKVENNAKKQNIDNKEFIDELIKNGIDPMVYFKNQLIHKNEFVEFPLIGGIHWRNEEVMDAIRRQMEKANSRSI